MDTHTAVTPTSALFYLYLEPGAFTTPTSIISTVTKIEHNPFDKAFKSDTADYALYDSSHLPFEHTFEQEHIGDSLPLLVPPSKRSKLYTNNLSLYHQPSISELKEFYMTSEPMTLDIPIGTTIPQPETCFSSGTNYQDLVADFYVETPRASGSSSVSSTSSYQIKPSKTYQQQTFNQQEQSAEPTPHVYFPAPPTPIDPPTPAYPARRGRGKARRRRAPLSIEETTRKHEAFLERNRVAAMKCRNKKKGMQEQLQEDVKFSQRMNEELKAHCEELLKEVAGLKSMALLYKREDGSASCQCEK